MDPVGPWSAYATYNRLAGVPQTPPSGDLHHLASAGAAASTPPTTAAQILPTTFLTPPTVGYEAVFSPLFHHPPTKPATHYVTHRQPQTKQDGDFHQTQVFFEQNPGAWQQNGPFGILPHETVVPTATGKNYENFNVHFAAQSINHLNSLAAKNAAIRVQSPQVIATNVKTQPITTFYQSNASFTTSETTSTVSKSYPTTNTQNIPIPQSCIVTTSNATNNVITKDYRIPQLPPRPPFIPTTNSVRLEKAFQSPNKQIPSPQQQAKPQAKTYTELSNHTDRSRANEEQTQQIGPISFSIMDATRLNYTNSVTNNGVKRSFPTNYRHYQPGAVTENEFQRTKEFSSPSGPDCNVIVPRRPSPLQAHSQASPVAHATSPAYPIYNSPMNTAIPSPQNNSNNHITPPSPLDVSVPRPNSQTNIAYPSVITRTMNADKNYADRFDRQNQNCWDDRRKFNNYNAVNGIEMPNRQIDGPNNHQATLTDLSSCRGDPMSIVKNLQQQQQTCHIPQIDIKQETKHQIKRRISTEKLVPINEVPGRIPPPAHTSTANQQPQNGYFDYERWNLPAPTAKIFSPPNMQHQGLMVPHPHNHHAPLPYFPPFHLAPHHHPEYTQNVEITPLPQYNEQSVPNHQQNQYEEQVDDQPKVVVPNIEEELNFLSETTLRPVVVKPRQQTQQNIPPPPIIKPPENKSNAGFMSSYLKFLQGEKDSSPPPAQRGGRKQTWSRTRPEVKPPQLNGANQTQVPPPPPPVLPPVKPQPAKQKKISQGDPQDDPRYFPLPKERKQSKFDSSDDLSSDEELFSKKPILAKDKPNVKKGRPCKPGGPTERKKAKLLTKQTKEKSKTVDLENIPRREISKRAAKEKVNLKLTTKYDEAEEPQEFVDSDSDPAWTPLAKEEADDDVPLKNRPKRSKPGPKKKVARNLITTAAEKAGIVVNHGNSVTSPNKKPKLNKHQLLGNAAPTLEDNIAAAVEKQKRHLNNKNNSMEHVYKPGEFVMIKSELSQSWPTIWRVDSKNLLQKYEPFQQNGATLYRNMTTYASWTPDNNRQYITIPVRYKSENPTEVIVEFIRNRVVILDPTVMEKMMKSYEMYQDNFEVYIQTLISQALDSNFLTEIFQEKDDYFLTNVKTIDDITINKKQKLVNTLGWPQSLHIAVSTWPCFNVIREFANNDLLRRNCMGCALSGVAVRVLMYGQPYNHTTLEGCPANTRICNEKDFILCRICAERVELYNKVAHQKYLMYIECAKQVTSKRTTDPQKDTTCILNELLADDVWLGQLFKGTRQHWAEIDSISQILLRNNITNNQ